MTLMLSEPLPLRTTRMLGDFVENSPLAYTFGDLRQARFPLRRISPTRGHAADHPMEITAAFVGDQRTDSWQAVIEPDITGQMCTFVDFGSPVPSDQQMQAAGLGMLHPTTGALIENLGEIAERISAIAGRSDQFQIVRQQCAVLDIRGAVWVATAAGEERSIQAWIDVPIKSAGAIWCSPHISRRYPAAVSGYVLELDAQTASNVHSEALAEDACDVLRIAFDLCAATGKPQKHVELTASPLRYGGLVKEIDLPCLRSVANAVVVGVDLLKRFAGQCQTVTLNSSRIDIRPGQWLRLGSDDGAHPQWPLGGDAPYVMTLAVDVDRSNNTVGIIGETMLFTPTVAVTAHSLALDDTFEGSLDVSERDGVVTFTVFDENRRGIQGARVTLDGSEPQTSNASGQVFFPFTASDTPTEHEVAIEAPGRIAQTILVTL